MTAIGILLIWTISFLAMFWVWSDATAKRGANIGCLWALIVLILGPVGFIAYLIVRNSN